MKLIDAIILIITMLVILLNLSNYFFKKQPSKCSCHKKHNSFYEMYRKDNFKGTN